MNRASLSQSVEFANPDLSILYDQIRVNAASLEDAYNDVTDDDVKTILYSDFANGYPFLTPRDNKPPTPESNSHDYLCQRTYENAGVHSSRITRFQIVDHPLYYLELFDQIDHRIEHSKSVLSANNSDDMIKIILGAARRLPVTREAREAAIAHRVAQTKGSMLSERLKAYQIRVHSGAIKSISDFYDPDKYITLIKDTDRANRMLAEIDRFRKPSTDDPVDNEMHRYIDTMMVVSTVGLSSTSKKYRLCYWGQERLRRIFGEHMRELSRGAASPHIIQQSFKEVPHDREISEEAQYNIKRRRNEMIDIMEDLYTFRKSLTIPITLAKACLRRSHDFEKFLYGESETMKPEEYERLMKEAARGPSHIKDTFSEAIDDAKTSMEIVKSLAASKLNREARQVLALYPNDRIKHLLNEMF